MDERYLELEQKRKQLLKKSLYWLMAWIPVILGVVLNTGVFGFFVLLFGIALYYIVCYQYYVKQYALLYKKTVLLTELEAVFEQVKVDFEEGFSEEEIERTCLVETYNRFHSDDYIEGVYKNCHFRRSDVRIQNVQSTGKSTTVVTMFEGPWMIFEFPKQFSRYTIIKEKEFLSNGKPGGWFSRYSDAEKVKFEDARFNERFVVYTTDGQEAFYLLTPHFMERLMEVEASVEGRFYFGFVENCFHVAIDNQKNAFEPSLMREVNEFDIQSVRKEVKMIAEMIDLLKLEQHI